MNKQLIGKISRYLVALYFGYAGIFTLVNKVNDLFSTKDNMLFIIKSLGAFIALGWSCIYFAFAFCLYRNKRNYFWAIIVYLFFWGFAGNLIFSSVENSGITSSVLSNSIAYLVLAVLVLLSKYFEPSDNEGQIKRARRILGENINHLSDNQLKKYLNK